MRILPSDSYPGQTYTKGVANQFVALESFSWREKVSNESKRNTDWGESSGLCATLAKSASNGCR